jgi:hypothetical protein
MGRGCVPRCAWIRAIPSQQRPSALAEFSIQLVQVALGLFTLAAIVDKHDFQWRVGLAAE